MRLVGGKLSNEGRVEVYFNGEWGTVCDDNWDIAEAQVVCRHLNFPGVVSAVVGAVYGQGRLLVIYLLFFFSVRLLCRFSLNNVFWFRFWSNLDG